jgi:hypothetical protein
MSDDVTAGSSPATGAESTSTATPDVSATAASSPADTSQGEQSSMLDAVRAALHPEDKAASPAARTPDQDKAASASEDEELPEEVSEDELKEQKPRTARRIRQLLGKIGEYEKSLPDLKDKAATLDRVVEFMDKSGLKGNDLDEGLQIMALVRTDPVKAWERLQPTIQYLQQFIGEQLPADLLQEVQQGYITEPRAREIARLRNQQVHDAARQQEQAKAQEEADRTAEVERLRGQATSVGNDWQSKKMSTDPDWHAKAPRVLELIELEVYRTKAYPQTPKDVIALCEKAYEQATKELRKQVPQATAKSPPVDPGSSTRSEAAPTSMLEAVRQGLRAGRAA